MVLCSLPLSWQEKDGDGKPICTSTLVISGNAIMAANADGHAAPREKHECMIARDRE